MSNKLSTTILVEDAYEDRAEDGGVAMLRFYVTGGGDCRVRGDLAGTSDLNGSRSLNLSADDARELGRWLRTNFGA